uniref:ZNF207-1 n=1 Tax=Schmidtea mediterranea TaxID=79327 RepID=H9CXU4_SCHMD|nr:ZNF207-1 [Schmidtea mediterranea]
MGRKKKKQLKPWCWYCNREFDDEKILIQHQKSKHFKCTFCHKKLYTGPGLSIHSMQVHKEKIDKIPFALPHRSNVEIEIYGMEGIPDEDIKEHERQKMGKDDEVDEKRIKLDISISNPVYPIPGIPISAPGVPFIPPLSVPVIPPMQFGLGPPPILVRSAMQMPGLMPHGLPRMNPIQNSVPVSLVMTTQQAPPVINQIKLENSIPPPPPPPPVTVEAVQANPTPTFPAYSGSNEAVKVIQKVAKPTSSSQNVKVILVHPEDDIPLEQIRLKLSKYSAFTNANKLTNDLSWSKALPANNAENENIPPPPPPISNTYMSQIGAPIQRPPPMIRPWIASNIGVYVKPNSYGGTSY